MSLIKDRDTQQKKGAGPKRDRHLMKKKVDGSWRDFFGGAS